MTGNIEKAAWIIFYGIALHGCFSNVQTVRIRAAPSLVPIEVRVVP